MLGGNGSAWPRRRLNSTRGRAGKQRVRGARPRTGGSPGRPPPRRGWDRGRHGRRFEHRRGLEHGRRFEHRRRLGDGWPGRGGRGRRGGRGCRRRRGLRRLGRRRGRRSGWRSGDRRPGRGGRRRLGRRQRCPRGVDQALDRVHRRRFGPRVGILGRPTGRIEIQGRQLVQQSQLRLGWSRLGHRRRGVRRRGVLGGGRLVMDGVLGGRLRGGVGRFGLGSRRARHVGSGGHRPAGELIQDVIHPRRIRRVQLSRVLPWRFLAHRGFTVTDCTLCAAAIRRSARGFVEPRRCPVRAAGLRPR